MWQKNCEKTPQSPGGVTLRSKELERQTDWLTEFVAHKLALYRAILIMANKSYFLQQIPLRGFLNPESDPVSGVSTFIRVYGILKIGLLLHLEQVLGTLLLHPGEPKFVLNKPE